MLTTPWISRLTAVLLLIGAVAILYLWVAEAILVEYRATDRAIEDVQEQLGRFQELAAMGPVLAKQLEQLASEQESKGRYLSGETDALAAAALQDRVDTLVEANGGGLRSIQPLEGVDEQGFRRITVRVEMIVTMESLFETLYALETEMPALFVENLDIQSRLRRRSNQVGMQVAADDAPLLVVGFDLSGYMARERK